MLGSARCTQASMVISCNRKLAAVPSLIASPLPSSTRPFPTLPAPNVALPASVPLFVPAESNPPSSQRHHPTNPAGGAVHDGVGLTVRFALMLTLVPYALVT